MRPGQGVGNDPRLPSPLSPREVRVRADEGAGRLPGAPPGPGCAGVRASLRSALGRRGRRPCDLREPSLLVSSWGPSSMNPSYWIYTFKLYWRQDEHIAITGDICFDPKLTCFFWLSNTASSWAHPGTVSAGHRARRAPRAGRPWERSPTPGTQPWRRGGCWGGSGSGGAGGTHISTWSWASPRPWGRSAAGKGPGTWALPWRRKIIITTVIIVIIIIIIIIKGVQASPVCQEEHTFYHLLGLKQASPLPLRSCDSSDLSPRLSFLIS